MRGGHAEGPMHLASKPPPPPPPPACDGNRMWSRCGGVANVDRKSMKINNFNGNTTWSRHGGVANVDRKSMKIKKFNGNRMWSRRGGACKFLKIHENPWK